ncbi:transcriptional regulator [Hirsutella rhossiliensis]|uniref:Transcriptional regulator n=1 Tax=Hirsutella rhossiliensis TaxID=111463 RepID=A0A9P8SJL1_9HYPO|nr:transcriptional regulator [Hirsutella rhossiliensis]KAH0965418.1 transcriptional regulator [Hirsutella rhossiliensis]
MAPPTEELEAALIDGTCQIYSQEPDATSVNKVRRHAEQKLELDDGFFAGDEWKNKSKALIKKYVDKLLDGWTPESNNEGKDSKNGTKRPSDEAESPKPKRRKRASQPRKRAKKEQSDTSEPEEKPKANKTAARRKSKKRTREVERESEDESKDMIKQDGSDSQDAKVAQSETKVESDDETKPSANKPAGAEKDGAEPIKAEEGNQAVEEEEEYSDVIDELPQPKPKRKDKKEPSSKPSKSASKKAAVSTPDDPDEAEIKKLQSQLVKCGIRKLWHNELKKYDGDARAKIRHLKKMLADIGMEGRFSEAKAREIKETRELMADAEAAQEMNALWGPEKGDVGDDDDDDAGNTFAARRRRAQADLAFLGDDSDSD